MFKAHPENSTMVLKEKCSDCRCNTIIEITPTSGGYGLQGGVLFKSSTDDYIAKCTDCHETNFKKDHNQKKWKINI